MANAALASRKDARDAVAAARKAFPGWAGRTAYNRAQIVYRIAEVMEDRRPQFVQAVVQSEGLSASKAEKVVDEAIDRLVWYAGWADKITQVVGNANPVAGPFFNLSTPEPTGVVAVLAPQESSLLGLIGVVAPAIVTGNTVVVVSSYDRPLPAVTFSEVLATSDVPGGVVNILTGSAATVGPWLASHMDVNAIDLTGIAGDPALATDLEVAAADNLKRVRRAPAAEPDWTLDPGLEPMTAFLETKTVWHPIGV
ncbi:aldehyde dehydrogenase family protein [Nocardioides caricicola]